jgi:hypothetical protein
MRRALVALAAVLALVVWRYAPPPARGADTPPAEFSAARAQAALARVLGDGSPHPTGTAANAAVRARLQAELAALGLQPQVEERFVCGAGARCATVVNLLARIAGTAAGEPAVLLACHYDSVWAGAGAADDGAGVATTLEAARALLAGPRPRRDVWLLIDDGEEQALLGAEAFVRDQERVRKVAAVVNVEARGTTGPSLLFELSTGNAPLVAAAARALPRPATNSIYYTIYQRLPNDTDLTVFKRAEMAGVNFAFVGGPLRYHTPRDDLEHLDLSSLQHHGDHALAMVRALAGEGGPWRAAGDAVFFDVLTLFVVRWPEPWTLPLAALGALLVAATVLLAGRRSPAVEGAGQSSGGARADRARSSGWAVAGALGGIVASLLLAWLLRWSLRALGALPYQWVAHAWPLQLAFWSAAVAATAAVAWAMGERLRPQGAWTATWTIWSLLALATAALAPGVSYPLVVPVLVAGAAGLVGVLRRGRRDGAAAAGAFGAGTFDAWATLPPLVAAALLLFPVAWMLYDGMGDGALPGLAAVVALALTTALSAFAAAPRRARARLAAAAGVVVLVAALAALVLPRFTADAPQPLSLTLYHDAQRAATYWVAGGTRTPLPPSLARAAPFAPDHPYPWAPESSAWTAPGPALPLAPPRLELESVERGGGQVRVRGWLRSPRGAPIGGLYLPGERLAAARLDGEEVPLPPLARRLDWQPVEHVTLPARGTELELVFSGEEAVDLFVYDVQPGLGPVGAELERARPSSAVPIGRGDRSLVSHQGRL